MVLALLMAFTGFFLLVGSFGGLMYLILRRGKEKSAGGGAATGQQEKDRP